MKKLNMSSLAILVLVTLPYFAQAEGTAPIAPTVECKPAMADPADTELTKKVARAHADVAAGKTLTTDQKASILNDDVGKAGGFYEIGAGQLIAGHFYRAGRAAKTVLDSVSKYAMELSDIRYGKSKTGYVSEERLESMLKTEFEQTIKPAFIDQPSHYDPTKTAFFVIADSTSTKAGGGHSWLGITYQAVPGGPLNTIKFHVRLLDPHVPAQAAALGTLGVNLVYAAFQKNKLNLDQFAHALKENLIASEHGRVEIDSMHVSGPDFEKYTDTDVAVTLLRTGLTSTVIVDADGNFKAPSQYFYKMGLLAYEVDQQLTNSLSKDEWDKARLVFSQATNSPIEKVREVNWLPIKENQLTDVAQEVELKASIEKMRASGVGVILSRLSGAGTLSKWNQSLILNNVGAVIDTAQYPSVESYFQTHERPTDMNITTQVVPESPYTLLLEVKPAATTTH